MKDTWNDGYAHGLFFGGIGSIMVIWIKAPWWGLLSLPIMAILIWIIEREDTNVSEAEP